MYQTTYFITFPRLTLQQCNSVSLYYFNITGFTDTGLGANDCRRLEDTSLPVVLEKIYRVDDSNHGIEVSNIGQRAPCSSARALNHKGRQICPHFTARFMSTCRTSGQQYTDEN